MHATSFFFQIKEERRSVCPLPPKAFSLSVFPDLPRKELEPLPTMAEVGAELRWEIHFFFPSSTLCSALRNFSIECLTGRNYSACRDCTRYDPLGLVSASRTIRRGFGGCVIRSVCPGTRQSHSWCRAWDLWQDPILQHKGETSKHKHRNTATTSIWSFQSQNWESSWPKLI